MKLRLLVFSLILAWCAGLLLTGCGGGDDEKTFNPVEMPYSVDIDPADFEDTNITGNEYFPLTVGTTYLYEGEDEDGAPIRIEVEVTDQTKVIMGVTAVVVEFREFKDGELIEETADWYAQDKQGNVWYFGEDAKEIEDGRVVSTEGSW